MNVKIIQPAGLGDIIFCLKIGATLVKQGHSVFWPVIPIYSWIKDYLIYDGIRWEDHPSPDKILDLQSGAKVHPEVPIMDAKYKMAGMGYSDWSDYFTFKRNAEKEDFLYDNLTQNQPYILVCNNFASPPGMLMRDIPIETSLKVVFLNYSNRFTPFDWSKIIENAAELHLVDTCFTYIAEKLTLKANKLALYSRDGHFYTDHLWKKPWSYIK